MKFNSQKSLLLHDKFQPWTLSRQSFCKLVASNQSAVRRMWIHQTNVITSFGRVYLSTHVFAYPHPFLRWDGENIFCKAQVCFTINFEEKEFPRNVERERDIYHEERGKHRSIPLDICKFTNCSNRKCIAFILDLKGSNVRCLVSEHKPILHVDRM